MFIWYGSDNYFPRGPRVYHIATIQSVMTKQISLQSSERFPPRNRWIIYLTFTNSGRYDAIYPSDLDNSESVSKPSCHAHTLPELLPRISCENVRVLNQSRHPKLLTSWRIWSTYLCVFHFPPAPANTVLARLRLLTI